MVTAFVSIKTIKAKQKLVTTLFFSVACVGCSEGLGQNRCTGITTDTCCNVYVNDMCDTACPAEGIFAIDSNSYSCGESSELTSISRET